MDASTNASDLMLPEGAPILVGGGDSAKKPYADMNAASTYSRCRYTTPSTTMTASILLACVSGITLYIASVHSDEDIWSRWVMAPIAGAFAACTIAILFTAEKESKRYTAGRILCAFFVAVVAPRYLNWQFPTLMTWVNDTILLFGGGAVAGLLGFLCGRRVVMAINRLAPRAAEKYTEDTIRKISTGKKGRIGHNQPQTRRFAQDDDRDDR